MTQVRYHNTPQVLFMSDSRFPGVESKVLETLGTHPNGGASVLIARIAVGGSIPDHSHPSEAETAYVVTGEGVLYTADGDYLFAPGVVVTIPPGLTHRLVNTGDVPLEVFAFHTPPTR
jgi:quercetin dioxygenase-like cupin family protein